MSKLDIDYPIILTSPNVMVEIEKDRVIITQQQFPTNIIVLTKEDAVALGRQLLAVGIALVVNL